MAQFIFSYRSASDYQPRVDPDARAAWTAFFDDVITTNVVDPGKPVFEPTTVLGEAGPSTRLGGYSIVTADDLDAALSMAKQCPAIARGGGVEVGVLADLPAEHPAEQIRARLSGA
jgi:hypothetical protein